MHSSCLIKIEPKSHPEIEVKQICDSLHLFGYCERISPEMMKVTLVNATTLKIVNFRSYIRKKRWYKAISHNEELSDVRETSTFSIVERPTTPGLNELKKSRELAKIKGSKSADHVRRALFPKDDKENLTPMSNLKLFSTPKSSHKKKPLKEMTIMEKIKERINCLDTEKEFLQQCMKSIEEKDLEIAKLRNSVQDMEKKLNELI